jgi:hypothetical protein
VAMRGMSQLLDDTIAAALPAETPPPATLREVPVTPASVTDKYAPTPSPAPARASDPGQPSAAAGAPASAPSAAPQEPPPPLIQESPDAPATRKPGLVSRFDDD